MRAPKAEVLWGDQSRCYREEANLLAPKTGGLWGSTAVLSRGGKSTGPENRGVLWGGQPVQCGKPARIFQERRSGMLFGKAVRERHSGTPFRNAVQECCSGTLFGNASSRAGRLVRPSVRWRVASNGASERDVIFSSRPEPRCSRKLLRSEWFPHAVCTGCFLGGAERCPLSGGSGGLGSLLLWL